MDEYEDWNIPAHAPKYSLREPTSDGKPWSFYKESLRLVSQQPVKPPAYSAMDPFLKAKNVMGLSGSTFQEFLDEKDVALVMFYNSSIFSKGDLQHKVLHQFVAASGSTKRENHVYAAIDCFKNKRFCKEDVIRHFPALRLYYRGQCLGTVKDVNSISAAALVAMVEEADIPE